MPLAIFLNKGIALWDNPLTNSQIIRVNWFALFATATDAGFRDFKVRIHS